LSHTNNIFELKSVDGIENRFEGWFAFYLYFPLIVHHNTIMT